MAYNKLIIKNNRKNLIITSTIRSGLIARFWFLPDSLSLDSMEKLYTTTYLLIKT